MPALPAPPHAPRQSALPRVPGHTAPARPAPLAVPRRGRRAWLAVLLALAVAITPLLASATGRGSTAAAPDMSGLRVAGNRLVNGAGQPVRLLGVNRAGAEYACIQGWGIFEGPTDAAAIAAIKAWHANAVRLPLNETCWLGINGAPVAYSGANYQSAIADYVARLTAAGLVVILDLHWSAPGGAQATGLQPMPNRDHSVAFWREVAAAHKGNSAVIFNLFNEPYPDDNADTAEAWRCWRDGGTCRGVPFQAAGMQELVTAVRDTGATNIILQGGPQYANTLSQWLAYKPVDPLNNLAADWHAYNFGWYTTEADWERVLGPTAARIPLVAGEIGQDDCGTWFVERAMAWLDGKGAGYLGWTWNVWGGCDPTLITDYSGSPTAMGRALRDHLAALAVAPPPPTPTATTAPPTPTATPTRTPTAVSPTATMPPPPSPALNPLPVISRGAPAFTNDDCGGAYPASLANNADYGDDWNSCNGSPPCRPRSGWPTTSPASPPPVAARSYWPGTTGATGTTTA